ncbi:hypothetical protein NGR_b06520 (plasmid) [Sinorhizobium fredii NGR234]|uniref:Uncharacterized protein n=1 Tax=Sinorhizobium fredii (strain NBRC 101917 / NGR234) TaxID=394 RepID=C3KPV2_SINFN|nr:hypothetical protein NGR_b06520 [Sinorhizobium fredii NGR234]
MDSLVELDGAICLIHSPSYRGHRRAGGETAKGAIVTATGYKLLDELAGLWSVNADTGSTASHPTSRTPTALIALDT